MFALFIFLVMIIGLDEFYRMNTNERQSPVKITGYIFTGLMAAYYFWLPAITLVQGLSLFCLLYTSPSPRDLSTSRMPSSA